MRSILKGTISFGLVNVPVKVYSAIEEGGLSFHQVHSHDHGKIRYKRVCELCGDTVEYADIARAYEFDDGQLAVITDEDIESLPAEKSREIEVLTFVAADELDPMVYDRSYYVAPENPAATKPYMLLARTLASTDRLAIVKFALRSRTRLGALRTRKFGDRQVLMVHSLVWPSQVREPEFPLLDAKPEIKDMELAVAMQVVDAMSGQFKPELYTDTYSEQMLELVEAKRSHDDYTPELPAALGATDASDLLAKLQASLAVKAQA